MDNNQSLSIEDVEEAVTLISLSPRMTVGEDGEDCPSNSPALTTRFKIIKLLEVQNILDSPRYKDEVLYSGEIDDLFVLPDLKSKMEKSLLESHSV